MANGAQAQYQEYVVSFVDLLGFKYFVQNNDAPTVLKCLEIVRDFNYRKPPDPDSTDEQVIAVSDCVVRARLANGPLGRFTQIFVEIHQLALIQLSLLDHGIVTRGGVTIGKVYIDECNAIVFGPAYNRAFELESKVAIHPRIIVDDVLVDEIGKSGDREDQNDVRLMQELLWVSEEGYHSLDYLGAPELDTEEQIPVYIRKHRDLVEHNLNDSGLADSVRAKFAWLASYHNGAVARLPDEFLEAQQVQREELIVQGIDSQTGG